jgi:hypothetical protein
LVINTFCGVLKEIHKDLVALVLKEKKTDDIHHKSRWPDGGQFLTFMKNLHSQLLIRKKMVSVSGPQNK